MYEMIDLVSIVGFLAAVSSIIQYIPQIIRIIKLKKARHVSFGLCTFALTSSILWCFYGFLKDAYWLLFSQGTAACIKIFLISLKIKYTSNLLSIKDFLWIRPKINQ